MQSLSKNNEELYKREQEALLKITQLREHLKDSRDINTQIYEDNDKLYSQLKQAETDNTKAFWIYISIIIVHAVILNLIH
jgi:hypothetical protein